MKKMPRSIYKQKKGMDKMIRGNNCKIKALALVLVSCLTVSMAGCGAKDNYVQPYSDYNLEEYVTLGEYKGLEVTKPEVKITEDEVKAEIDNRLQAASKQVEKKEGTAAEGDSVKIVYTGKIAGKVFEGGSTGEEGTTVTIGNSGYIEGFDTGLVGMKVGDTKTLKLKFPKDYWDADKADKDVDFDVTLKALMITETPKYDVDFVKKNSEAKSLEDYEKGVKKELTELKNQASEDNMRNQLWASIMDNSKVIKYPEAEMTETKKVNEEYYESYAKQYGIELMEFISQYTGMDEKAYDEYQQQYAEAIVAQEMVMYSIAKAEDISVSSKEYKEELKAFMELQGITDEAEFKEQYGMSFEEYAGKDNLMKSFLLEKILEFAMDNAKIVDEKKEA